MGLSVGFVVSRLAGVFCRSTRPRGFITFVVGQWRVGPQQLVELCFLFRGFLAC